MTPDHLVRIGVCITPETRARLDRAAAAEDMTLSNFTRRLIGRYLVALDQLEDEEAAAEQVAA